MPHFAAMSAHAPHALHPDKIHSRATASRRAGPSTLAKSDRRDVRQAMRLLISADMMIEVRMTGFDDAGCSDSFLKRDQTASWSNAKPRDIQPPCAKRNQGAYGHWCQPKRVFLISSRNARANLSAPASSSVSSLVSAFSIVADTRTHRFQAKAFCRSGVASARRASSNQPINTSVRVGPLKFSGSVMTDRYRTEIHVLHGPGGAIFRISGRDGAAARKADSQRDSLIGSEAAASASSKRAAISTLWASHHASSSRTWHPTALRSTRPKCPGVGAPRLHFSHLRQAATWPPPLAHGSRH